MGEKKYIITILVGVLLLQLPLYTKGEEEEVFLPNMHMQLGCETCHSAPAEVGVDTRESVKLTSPNNDVIALCEPCHPNQEAHPNGVDPKASKINVPEYLFLGVKGNVNEGKLICTTCHDIHAEFSSGKLLRGFAQKKGDKGRYTQKIELCKDCHGEDLLKRSPHKGEEKTCAFCHGADPKQQQQGGSTIKSDIISLCNFCHVSERQPHFFKFANLFTDTNIKEDLKKMTLPLSKNKKLTCATCHNPHGNENPKKHYLREEFVLLAGKSNKINPHWTDTFCTSCHDKVPQDGQSAFKFNNNPDSTCLWCHKEDEGAELHPYGVPAKDSKYTKVQKDKVKLINETISCITCHSKDCEKKEKETGRNFLRGGPYVNRNDICFNCHILEVFKKINPHRQKDMQGKVDYEICNNCHIGIPDEEKKENIDLKGSELFLCLRCHPDRPHPGTDIKTGSGINHIVQPKEIPNKIVVPKDVPLSKKGKMMCSSCHAGHLEGITKRIFKPRLQNECTDCHIGI